MSKWRCGKLVWLSQLLVILTGALSCTTANDQERDGGSQDERIIEDAGGFLFDSGTKDADGGASCEISLTYTSPYGQNDDCDQPTSCEEFTEQAFGAAFDAWLDRDVICEVDEDCILVPLGGECASGEKIGACNIVVSRSACGTVQLWQGFVDGRCKPCLPTESCMIPYWSSCFDYTSVSCADGRCSGRVF